MLRRIKLAMLVNDLNMNGISNVVLSYCRELNKYEFEIHIIAGTPVNPVHRQDAIQNNIRQEKKRADIITKDYLKF